MVVSLAFCYASKVQEMSGNYMGTIISSILAFFIFSGIFNEGADVLNLLGANGLFTAIISTLFANTLYFWLNKKIRIDIRIYTSGTDDVYFHMLRYILPILIIGVAATSLNLVFYALFGVQNFQDLYILGLSSLFQWAGRNFGSTLLYVFMVHFLWFFGIHGGNVWTPYGAAYWTPGWTSMSLQWRRGMCPQRFTANHFLTSLLSWEDAAARCAFWLRSFFSRGRGACESWPVLRRSPACLISTSFCFSACPLYTIPLC